MPVILLDDQMRAPVDGDGDGSMAVNEGSIGDPRVKLTCPWFGYPKQCGHQAEMSVCQTKWARSTRRLNWRWNAK